MVGCLCFGDCLCSTRSLHALLCSQNLSFVKWNSFACPEVLCPHFSQPPLLDSRACTLCTIIAWLHHVACALNGWHHTFSLWPFRISTSISLVATFAQYLFLFLPSICMIFFTYFNGMKYLAVTSVVWLFISARLDWPRCQRKFTGHLFFSGFRVLSTGSLAPVLCIRNPLTHLSNTLPASVPSW